MEICVKHLQAGLHEFHGSGRPGATNQTLQKLGESSSVTLDRSDDDHNHVGIRIEFGGMRDTIVNLYIKMNIHSRMSSEYLYNNIAIPSCTDRSPSWHWLSP